MGKVILIMENPKNCKSCKLSEMSSDFDKRLCVPTQESYDKFSDIKPDWCPLKELPEKRKELNIEEYEFGKLGLAFASGWNACLKNMLSE